MVDAVNRAVQHHLECHWAMLLPQMLIRKESMCCLSHLILVVLVVADQTNHMEAHISLSKHFDCDVICGYCIWVQAMHYLCLIQLSYRSLRGRFL